VHGSKKSEKKYRRRLRRLFKCAAVQIASDPDFFLASHDLTLKLPATVSGFTPSVLSRLGFSIPVAGKPFVIALDAISFM